MGAVDYFKKVVLVSDVEFYATIGKLGALRRALDAGGNPNAADADGYSALHGASENGHTEAVKVLLEHGARAWARTRDGLTPLDLAEICDHDEIGVLLRQFGGDAT
jgi:ankyrin repeat protein